MWCWQVAWSALRMYGRVFFARNPICLAWYIHLHGYLLQNIVRVCRPDSAIKASWCCHFGKSKYGRVGIFPWLLCWLNVRGDTQSVWLGQKYCGVIWWYCSRQFLHFTSLHALQLVYISLYSLHRLRNVNLSHILKLSRRLQKQHNCSSNKKLSIRQTSPKIGMAVALLHPHGNRYEYSTSSR